MIPLVSHTTILSGGPAVITSDLIETLNADAGTPLLSAFFKTPHLRRTNDEI